MGNPWSHLIDDIADWMNKLQRLARDSHVPARLVHAERRLADAVFTALTHDYTYARWQAVLEAAVDIEAIQASGTAIAAGPIPRLKPAWVAAIYDRNSAEVRLALAIGSAAGGFGPDGTVPSVDRRFDGPLGDQNTNGNCGRLHPNRQRGGTETRCPQEVLSCPTAQFKLRQLIFKRCLLSWTAPL